jgi:hypothetical protein
MNKLVIPIVTLFFFACNNNNKATVKDAKTEVDTIISAAPTVTPSTESSPLLGSYVGPFGDNKITMLIIKVKNDSVDGRTIVGGNDRPFSGTVRESGGIYTFHAKEPGDHKDDGVFDFSIALSNADVVTGSWKANDPKRVAKEYTLQRKKFEYMANVGTWPESSTRLLKADDVENLPKSELEFMRNEIFARHGYCFRKKDLRQQFEMEDWYVPNTVDIKGFLTDTEKKNIALIKRYEKYAEDYGDEYGR